MKTLLISIITLTSLLSWASTAKEYIECEADAKVKADNAFIACEARKLPGDENAAESINECENERDDVFATWKSRCIDQSGDFEQHDYDNIP